MSGAVLIRGARQLLTLRGPRAPRRGAALRELEIIPDGALLIADGRIMEVGPSRRVENLAPARRAREIDVTNRVVMPGFVDCHTHLVSAPPLLSDYETQIASGSAQPLEPAPETVLSAVRQASAARLGARSSHILNAMFRHGTTTLEAKSGYGFDETGETKILRVHALLNHSPLDVVSTFLFPRSMPPGYPQSVPNYLAWICTDLLPKIRRRGLARYVDCYCDNALLNDAQIRLYLEAAQRSGFGIKVHAALCHADNGVCLALALNAVTADHLDYASRADIELLARSNTVAVLLPGGTFRAADAPNPSARALIDAGAAVALATDFDPGANPTCSMQMILALACTQLRMSPAEAICAATFNGACALGAEDRVGTLEVGKSADLIVVNAEDYREIPYYFGVNLVNMTIKRGVTIYQA